MRVFLDISIWICILNKTVLQGALLCSPLMVWIKQEEGRRKNWFSAWLLDLECLSFLLQTRTQTIVSPGSLVFSLTLNRTAQVPRSLTYSYKSMRFSLKIICSSICLSVYLLFIYPSTFYLSVCLMIIIIINLFIYPIGSVSMKNNVYHSSCRQRVKYIPGLKKVMSHVLSIKQDYLFPFVKMRSQITDDMYVSYNSALRLAL